MNELDHIINDVQQRDRVADILNKINADEKTKKRITGPVNANLPDSTPENPQKGVIFALSFHASCNFRMDEIDSMNDVDLKEAIIKSLRFAIGDIEDDLNDYDLHINKQ